VFIGLLPLPQYYPFHYASEFFDEGMTSATNRAGIFFCYPQPVGSVSSFSIPKIIAAY
jgi:hypothetical protein